MAGHRIEPLLHHLRKMVRPAHAVSQTDDELLGQFIDTRDPRAFEALVRRHGSMVFSVCRRLAGNDWDAHDAFQAVFIVLVRKAASISPREAVGNWLYGVAYRTAAAARASNDHRRLREQQVPTMPESQARSQKTSDELREVLDHELHKLPEKYRLPVVLCELEGRSREEVARQLGIPPGTLSWRLATARKMLAKRLAKYGPFSGAMLAASLAETSAASVPPALLSSTFQVASGVVSAKAAAFAQGVIKMMYLAKLKTVSWGILLAASVSMGAVGLSAARQGTAPTSPPPAADSRPKDPRQARDKLEPTLVAAGRRPAADTNILQNSGIEEGITTSAEPHARGEADPAHWSQGAMVEGVEYIWDRKLGYKSKSSLCLRKTAARYFPIAQWFQTVERHGADPEIRVSAQVKAEKVTKAILDVVFLDEKGKWISHEWAAYIGAKKAADPPADHDWKEYSDQVKIPSGTRQVRVCLQVYGPGKVWFDEVRATYLDEDRTQVPRVEDAAPDTPDRHRFEDVAQFDCGLADAVGGNLAIGVRDKGGYTVVVLKSAAEKSTLSFSFALREEDIDQAADYRLVAVDRGGKHHEGTGAGAVAAAGRGLVVATMSFEFDLPSGNIKSLIVQRRMKPAPDTEGTDVDGKELRLSDFQGKVVLLVFWNSLCKPCMTGVSHLQELMRAYAGRRFTVVGVNSGDGKKRMAATINTYGMTWPSFYDGEDGPIIERWKLTEIPTVYLIDAKGMIRLKNPADNEELDRTIKELVKRADAK